MMPANLTYQLALTRAEAMQFRQALALFKNRFFPADEIGTKSAEVRTEVELMQADAWAKGGNCTAADSFIRPEQERMNSEGGSSREYVRLAAIAKRCGHAEQSGILLHKAVAGVGPMDLVWAIRAEKSLGAYDSGKANERIEKALAEEQGLMHTRTYQGFWSYDIGMLQAALNQKDRAKETFERVLILPDSHMSHHLAREALTELQTRGE